MNNKDYAFEILPVKKINRNDRRFCISYPVFDEKLTTSIKNTGIIQPIILKKQTPFVVISGFKRLESALFLSLENLPCIITSVTDKEACLITINENLLREMNIVEKAHCINMMLNYHFSLSEIFEIMELIGLGRHEKVIKKMINIANSEEMLKDYIVKHNLSLKNIEYLLWFEHKDREGIINSFSNIHVTESMLREILQMLALIKIKTETLPYEVLNGFSDPYELRKALKKRINPQLTKLENKFKALIHALNLQKNIDIKIDPFFEKEYIDITIKVKESYELERALNELLERLKSGEMEAIFGLTKSRVP